MEVIRSGKALGAEIKGIDLSQNLSQDEIDGIKKAWDENLVLTFKNQNLDDPRLIEFSKYFGNLDLPAPNPFGINFSPKYPEINVISNVKKEGKPTGILGDGEATWHSDMTYQDVPPKAGILYSCLLYPSPSPRDRG